MNYPAFFVAFTFASPVRRSECFSGVVDVYDIGEI
jgi:hypothetical protein